MESKFVLPLKKYPPISDTFFYDWHVHFIAQCSCNGTDIVILYVTGLTLLFLMSCLTNKKVKAQLLSLIAHKGD